MARGACRAIGSRVAQWASQIDCRHSQCENSGLLRCGRSVCDRLWCPSPWDCRLLSRATAVSSNSGLRVSGVHPRLSRHPQKSRVVLTKQALELFCVQCCWTFPKMRLFSTPLECAEDGAMHKWRLLFFMCVPVVMEPSVSIWIVRSRKLTSFRGGSTSHFRMPKFISDSMLWTKVWEFMGAGKSVVSQMWMLPSMSPQHRSMGCAVWGLLLKVVGDGLRNFLSGCASSWCEQCSVACTQARLVPMAVPQSWSQCALPNWKTSNMS